MNVEKGFVDAPVDPSVDLVAEIKRLKKEKNAVVLAHYYTIGEIQDLADFIGDSLALARIAEKLDNDIIVMCGVHFMGETVKILCPDKKYWYPISTPAARSPTAALLLNLKNSSKSIPATP